MERLALTWRRHRIRLGKIPCSLHELRVAMRAVEELADWNPRIQVRDIVRLGYYELLVAASTIVLERERRGEDPLPVLLVASGAVS